MRRLWVFLSTGVINLKKLTLIPKAWELKEGSGSYWEEQSAFTDTQHPFDHCHSIHFFKVAMMPSSFTYIIITKLFELFVLLLLVFAD